MTPLSDNIVLITGASSGIGLACAKAFAHHGARLIVAARRKERLEVLAKELKQMHKTDSHIIELDVRNYSAVENAMKSLPKEWQEIDVLVNNAGLSRGLDKLYEGSIQDWDEMIDTNVKGLLYVSRAVIPGMVARNKGTIINIGSIAGHEVYPKGNVYCASKHAVDALTKGLRMDLVDTPIRVCTVDPGLVETEFSLVRFRGDAERAAPVYQNMKTLEPGDVADAVVFCATRPAHVQLAELIIMPTNQGSTTLVHRTPTTQSK
ncbi:MAG: SDR family oxidoreductase [Ignavibacteriales bacterium]|nr:SDR family oxidoreductase [Ignavibacteriales bacterium]